tara:strand:+ start:188 stop:802 length:615 start_codon:yes stop_codon:yes gene_type:complete
MASTDTDVSICSQALLLLGSTSISSFSDGTAPASIAQVIYPKVKAQTLGMYPWSFSLTKTQLARSASTPLSYWQYGYALPSDMVNGVPRKVFVSNNTNAPNLTDYEIQGAELLSQEQTIFIDYQRDVNEQSMPAYFVQLLIYQVAWHLAEPVTDQTTKSEYWKTVALGTPLESLRGGYFRQATAIDGSGQSSQVLADYVLVDVR